MARIDIDVPQFRVPQGQLPAPSSQGAAVLEQASREIIQVGERLDKKRRQDAEVAAQLKLAQIEAADIEQERTDVFNGNVKDGYALTRLRHYDDRADAVITDAENDYEREALEHGLAYMKPGYMSRNTATMLKQQGITNYNAMTEANNKRGFIVAADPATLPEQRALAIAALNGYQGTDEQRAKIKEQIDSLGSVAFDNIIATDPKKALDLIDGNNLEAFGFDSGQVAGYRKKAKDQYDTNIGKQQAVNKATVTGQIQEYADTVGAEPPVIPKSNPDLEKDDGPLSAVDDIALNNSLQNVTREKAKKEQGYLDFRKAISNPNGFRMDPKDTEQKKYLDLYHKNVIGPAIAIASEVAVDAARKYAQESGQPLAPEEEARIRGEARSNALINNYRDVGTLPESVISDLRASMRNGTAEEKYQASEFYQKFVSLNPQFKDDMTEEDRRMLVSINDYVKRGYTREVAVKKAEDELAVKDNIGEKELADIRSEFNRKNQPPEGDTRNQNEIWLADQFDEGWWYATPGVRANVSAKFNQAVEQEYYVNGQNIDTARKTSLDNLRNVFGMSRVNGVSEIMRQPPEQYFKVPGFSDEQNADWISADAQDEASAGTANPDEIRGHVKIVPYPDVTGKERMYNGAPVWALSIQNEKAGENYVPDKNGKPLAWQPDPDRKARRGLTIQEKTMQAWFDVKAGVAPRRSYTDPHTGTVLNRKGGRVIGRMMDVKNPQTGEVRKRYVPINPSQPF